MPIYELPLDYLLFTFGIIYYYTSIQRYCFRRFLFYITMKKSSQSTGILFRIDQSLHSLKIE